MQNILIAALAAFFFQLFGRTATASRTVPSTAKMLIVLGAALFFVAIQWDGELSVKTVIPPTFAAAGLAALFHKLHRLLSSYGDWKIREIMAASLASAARRR